MREKINIKNLVSLSLKWPNEKVRWRTGTGAELRYFTIQHSGRFNLAKDWNTIVLFRFLDAYSTIHFMVSSYSTDIVL